MEANQSLYTLLLGKIAPLPPPTPSISPTPPPPTPLINKDEPIIIWNPQLVQPALPTHNHNTDDISSNRNTPAIVEDDSGNNSPIPSHSTRPPCHQLICPLQNCPLTHNQLRLCTAHMINCVIMEELMPTPSLCTHPPSLHRRYAIVAESILLETISPPSHSTVHFIGAIIDDNTGDVLKYQHLMKMDKHSRCGPTVLPMKLGNSSRISEMSPALTHAFSSPSHLFQLTNAPPTAAFAAITNHRRMSELSSLLGSKF
jgi:hypothetical protein